jgi:large subunit ribosomal protein L30
MATETFKIIQIRSPIRRHWKQRQTLIGLGLNRIGRTAEVANTPSTWGKINKVHHLVRVVDQDLFELHRIPGRHRQDETEDKRLVRNLVLDPRGIGLEDIPRGENKTPDFKLIKNGELVGYGEMKSPNDGDLFDFPSDLAPGEIRREVRRDPGVVALARIVAKASKQFDAVNHDRAQPNILFIVNHARGKGPGDLRMALDGIPAPDGRRFFPLVNEMDQWEIQHDVWRAAQSIDLFVWIDPRRRSWEPFRMKGAPRLAEACALLNIGKDSG